jgi:hypothetical protein
MKADSVTSIQFRERGAARAGGYVLALASLLVVIGLVFHPVPAGGFEEQPSVLSRTPWWGPIHVAIAIGFVLCVVGGILMLAAGGRLLRPWVSSLFWGAPGTGRRSRGPLAVVSGRSSRTWSTGVPPPQRRPARTGHRGQ